MLYSKVSANFTDLNQEIDSELKIYYYNFGMDDGILIQLTIEDHERYFILERVGNKRFSRASLSPVGDKEMKYKIAPVFEDIDIKPIMKQVFSCIGLFIDGDRFQTRIGLNLKGYSGHALYYVIKNKYLADKQGKEDLEELYIIGGRPYVRLTYTKSWFRYGQFSKLEKNRNRNTFKFPYDRIRMKGDFLRGKKDSYAMNELGISENAQELLIDSYTNGKITFYKNAVDSYVNDYVNDYNKDHG